MALPKIKIGDVVTVFGRDCVVGRLDEGASDYDLWTDDGWYHSRDVVKVMRRRIIGWRHKSPVPVHGADDRLLPLPEAFAQKKNYSGRVVRVVRKRTWHKVGAK